VRDDEFEWDDRKAARDYGKYKVTFESARSVFEDPRVFLTDDDRQDGTERRFIAVGTVDRRLIHDPYTLRGERTRIISARLAEPWERRRYVNVD
jgi:uncharacterized DUF497 family protein